MLYENVHVFVGALRVIDAMTLGASAALLWVVATRLGMYPDDGWADMLIYLGCLVLSFAVLAGRMRIYRVRRTEHLPRELVALLQVAFCAIGLSCLLVEIIGDGLPGSLYGMTALAGMVGLLGSRLGVRAFLRGLRRRSLDRRTWLVVGRNARSAHIAREVLANPHFGIGISQIVDLRLGPGREPGGRVKAFNEAPLAQLPQVELNDVDQLRGLIIGKAVDEVVVTLPLRSFYAETTEILRVCGEAGISVKLPSEAFDCPQYKTEVANVGGIALVTHYTGPSSRAFLAVKRVLDTVGAAVGLLLCLPLHIPIAIAIKLTSRGPVFFRQQRVGLHGRQFTMIKYRTMVADAPQQLEDVETLRDTDGPAFKMKNDPRITRVGRSLRKHHLDELPQLWNVLVGEMSLVGPRPLPPGEVNNSEWWQRRRLSMPPGLTCLWQVAGDYKLPFKRWMELDLEYIDRWSVMLDVRVMLATIRTVLRGSGW